MIGSIIISIFVLIVVLFVYIEYKNEKKYQDERYQKHPSVKKEKQPAREPKKVPSPKELEEKRLKPELIPEPEVTKKVDLPECSYPKFDHSRLLKMGLSEEESKEFVAELIPQIETQIPLIKEAIAAHDLHTIEQLIHNIKGSATTIGTGGISDLLLDYNTYLRKGMELTIVEAYFEHLKYYYEELKEQYA